MTRSLAAIALDLAPGLFPNGSISVVRIETTRPVFLLFGSDWNRPVCVAQIGSHTYLETIRLVLSTLHNRIPDLVPASLACVSWRGEQYVHIQEGLPGMPWFRLRETLHGEGQWTRLEQKARRGLERFHAAIAETPDWRCRVVPGTALRHQVRLLAAQDSRLLPRTTRALDKAAETMDSLGEIEWFWQHGDFCLNNLLVTPSGVGIVDFDEFGATSVPLHDEIGLGLSVYQLSSHQEDWGMAGRHVLACVDPTLRRHPELSPSLPGLFLHYLVWRVNQGFGRPRREAACAGLRTIIDAFAEEPARFFPVTPDVRQ